MVCPVLRSTDEERIARASVVYVCAQRVIHERLVVRDVVAGVHDRIIARETCVMLAAYCTSLSVHTRRCEAPWNQPQVMPLAFSRSPTFLPDTVIWLTFWNLGFDATQSSSNGRGSPIIAPVVIALAMLPDALAGLPFGRVGNKVAGNVFPATRLSAPGVEGPNVVPQELSLIAKYCA